MHKAIVLLAFLISLSAEAQKPKSTDVRLEIQPDPNGEVLVHWSITNNTKLAVYVYDFFLWGPAPWNEQRGNLTVLGTTPSRENPSCPPNRVVPFLLLVIAPGRTIHGDFIDSELKLDPKTNVSMRIGAMEAAHPKGVNFLNFANTDYPGIGPGGHGSGTQQYGMGNAPGMRAAVLIGRLDDGHESDSELVFRISEVGSHELGHGMGFYSHNWSFFGGFFNPLYNAFSNDLMNEGQGMPNSKHPEYFDMTVPQNRQTVDEINKQPPQ